MATSTPDETPPKSRKRLIAIVLAALAVAAAAGYYFYAHGGDHHATDKAAVPVDPIFLALDPFTVNLQANSRNRFLHVGVTLKLGDAESRAMVTQYLPEVRSRVLAVLSNRQAEKLLTPEEKISLADEIMTELNLPLDPSLPSSTISSVLFTAFMLQ
jgi:flagellar FliL protein